MTPDQAREAVRARRDVWERCARLEGQLAAAEATLRSQGTLLDQRRDELATRTRERDHLHQELIDAQAQLAAERDLAAAREGELAEAQLAGIAASERADRLRVEVARQARELETAERNELTLTSELTALHAAAFREDAP